MTPSTFIYRTILGLGAVLIMGCSPNYMPLGDARIIGEHWAPSNESAGFMWTMICTPDESICGRRNVDDDEYDPDVVTDVFYDEDVELPFRSSNFEASDFEGGFFESHGTLMLSDGTQRIHVNNLPPIRLEMPQQHQITAPLDEDRFSRTIDKHILLQWEPANTGLPMKWELHPLDSELEELPCDGLDWGIYEGEVEDTGQAEISLSDLPANLAAEGCDMVLILKRTAVMPLPEGISNGLVTSTIIDGSEIWITP